MNYLHTTDSKVVEEFCAMLDKVAGYPNPATLTERAVMPEQLKDGSWMVPVPDSLYSPAVKRYIDAHAVIPASKLTVVDKATDVASALFAASAGPAPTASKDQIAAKAYVLITESVKDAKATTAQANEEPIEGETKPK